jgi:hypothetical protein
MRVGPNLSTIILDCECSWLVAMCVSVAATSAAAGPAPSGSSGHGHAAHDGSWTRWRGRSRHQPVPGQSAPAAYRQSAVRWLQRRSVPAPARSVRAMGPGGQHPTGDPPDPSAKASARQRSSVTRSIAELSGGNSRATIRSLYRCPYRATAVFPRPFGVFEAGHASSPSCNIRPPRAFLRPQARRAVAAPVP